MMATQQYTPQSEKRKCSTWEMIDARAHELGYVRVVQYEIADDAGITEQQLVAVKKGRAVSEAVMKSLADWVGCPVDELFPKPEPECDDADNHDTRTGLEGRER